MKILIEKYGFAFAIFISILLMTFLLLVTYRMATQPTFENCAVGSIVIIMVAKIYFRK